MAHAAAHVTTFRASRPAARSTSARRSIGSVVQGWVERHLVADDPYTDDRSSLDRLEDRARPTLDR